MKAFKELKKVRIRVALFNIDHTCDQHVLNVVIDERCEIQITTRSKVMYLYLKYELVTI
jgi:hypothetical protein